MRAISDGLPDQTAATTAPGDGRERGRGGERWRWAVGLLLAAAVLMFCYLRIAGATQVNSDGAGIEWEAWDILHGNVLLHGWWATDVSFYTTELPEYLAVTAVAGLRPEVVHICSALTYTLLVLLAALVARGRARGAAGAVRALLAAGVILAPQPTGPTQVLLGSPDHVGTGVPVLILLLLLERASTWQGRSRWCVPAGAGVLLAWSIIGDPLIEVIGVLPLVLVCLARAGSIRRSGRPWSATRYELSLAAAAALAVPVAAAANRLITHFGGFSMASPWYHLEPLGQIVRGLPLAGRSVLALFGADSMSVGSTGNKAFALVHLLGVAVVLTAFAVAAWQLVRSRGDLVADFLVLAIAANVVAFLIDVQISNIYSAHEIGPVLSLGAALAGRTLGSRIPVRLALPGPVQSGPAQSGPVQSRWGRALLPALAAGLACYAVLLGIATAHPQGAPRNVGLTAWLLRHHLTSGLAPYWEASSVTVDSGGAVTVVAVWPHGAQKHLVPEQWQNDVQLAESRTRTASFVITSPAEDVNRASVLATFGKPAGSYRYGPYTILVWRGNLLPRLIPSAKAATVSTPRAPPASPT